MKRIFIIIIFPSDKTVKIWKVYEKQVSVLERDGDDDGLVVPRVSGKESILTSTPRRVFANAHAYHINSISLNCDGETFLSADDLRVNLWNLNVNSKSFS